MSVLFSLSAMADFVSQIVRHIIWTGHDGVYNIR